MSRPQLRAICPVCFAQQAVRGNVMVTHGYRQPWLRSGDGSHTPDCSGTMRPHFGTEAGRDIASDVARRHRMESRRILDLMLEVQEGTKPVMVKVWVKSGSYGSYQYAPKDNPMPHEKHYYLSGLKSDSDGFARAAAEIEERVKAWVPTAPVEVPVQERGPVLHLASRRWVGPSGAPHKACAGSRMAAENWARTTEDPAKVTCTRCLSRMSRRKS